MTTDVQLRMQIKDLRRDLKDGFWRATLVLDGEALEVHRRHGSWMTDTVPMHELQPWVSADLQVMVRDQEADDRKALKDAADSNPFIAKSLGITATEGAAA